MNRVRVGSQYLFTPVLIDVCDARTSIPAGTVVRVVNLPGAPKANTMGHCHIELLDGTFAGMVCTNSLTKVSK